MGVKLYVLAIFLFILEVKGQDFSGRISVKEREMMYREQIFITNLNAHYTVIADVNGSFRISSKEGDKLRITSSFTERKDVTVTAKHLKTDKNFVEINLAYHDIPEVIIKFRPTGILKKDVLSLKDKERKMDIAKVLGLPEPKGDGYSPEPAISVGLGVGATGLVEHVHDLISGDIYRKRRLKEFEITERNITEIKKYFGTEYFTKLRIPNEMIDDFLKFVYKSDEIKKYVVVRNFDAIQPYFEKYLPVYIKRLQDSKLIKSQE